MPGTPGRTHFLDEMPPDALDAVEREATERLAGLNAHRQRIVALTDRNAAAELAEVDSDVAAVAGQLEQIKLARAETGGHSDTGPTGAGSSVVPRG